MPLKHLSAAPATLFDSNGRPNYGNFAGPIADCNHEAFDYTRLNRWPWTASPRLAAKLLKRWQFVGVIDENIVLGAAVIHLNYAGAGFAYVYDRHTGKIVESNFKSPLARHTEFSRSAAAGASRIQVGANVITMQNTMTEGRRDLQVSCRDKITADVVYTEHGHGVSTVTRMAMYGFGHTYKFVGMPASGAVVAGDKQYTLTKNAMAILDWSSATAPRNTIWNWASAAGHAKTGEAVGINFSSGIISGGFTENTVWVDGEPTMIEGVNFDYNQRDVLAEPWQVSTAAKDIDLTFRPDHERYEAANLLIAASRLHQPFGGFDGTIQVGGKTLDVNLYGFCEEHYAKW